ncbi:MAG: STAS domain-containing protein [Planctomycetota bacterium]
MTTDTTDNTTASGDDAPGIRLTIDTSDAASGVAAFTLSGYLDESTQGEVAAEIKRSFEAGCHRIALDLANVSFMTSTGLAALMELWHTAREAGGDLVVLNPPPTISVLLRVLKLNEKITIADNREAVRAHFENLASLPEPLPADDSATPDRLPGTSSDGG